MVDFQCKESYDVYDLKKLVAVLRGEGGCPWDREQTHESIRRNLLEEAYEVAEAIDEKSAEHMCEELGDLLLQVMFHSDMEETAGRFDLNDVADGVCKKLILRHPHIFGDVRVSDSGQVLQNWDSIKREEKQLTTVSSSMDAVAKSLPALWRAEKVQKKAAKAGFDWPDISGAMDKLHEELTELKEAINSGEGIEEELGDLLFAAVNTARFLKIDPEDALNLSSDKFIARFFRLEEIAAGRGFDPENLSLYELDKLYEEAKSDLRNEE